jgi:pimeloyl-ACP methyl ester carboxylesterase/2-polyprenyl-6-methoxyphenol hydroxylase-like FAD-dependent oxidoreductase
MAMKDGAKRPVIGEHAVVIGGSIAGLLGARAVADHYERVTIVERDRLPTGSEQRKAVPQGRHIHGLLARGLREMEELLPGIGDEMIDDGAPAFSTLADTYLAGYGRQMGRIALGLGSVTASRPFIEAHVRSRVLALANVKLRDRCEVRELVAGSGKRVTGVVAVDKRAGAPEETLAADLVVAASGRSARVPAWLEALGYGRPPESRLDVDLSYASRPYTLPPGSLTDKMVLVGARPGFPRALGMVAHEGDDWLVTLAGYGEHKPPTEPKAFEQFLASVAPSHALTALERGDAGEEIVAYGFPGHQRRHYERMRHFPAGFVAIGDALCSFNPLYGQGMTVAAVEAVALRDCLARGERRLARRYFRATKKIVNQAWQLATGADLGLPEVEAERSLSVRLSGAYAQKVREASGEDAEVSAALARVVGLLESPSHLMRPRILRRVLGGYRDGSPMWPGKPPGTPLRRRTLRVGGLHTPLLEAGPAEASEAVVFVHGVPGSGADLEPLLAATGALGRAVAWDAPGFGKAAKPPDFDQSAEGHGAFIGRALAELGIERAHLVLHDFGGLWGLAWGMSQPERLASVTLLCTGVPIGYRWHRTARLWRTPRAGELAMATATRSAFRMGLRRAGPKRLPGPFVDRMFDDFDSDTRKAILRLYRASGALAEWAREGVAALRPLDRPALVIFGRHDPVLSPALADRQREAFPGAEIHVLEGSGHWPFIDQAERVEQLLLDFLARTYDKELAPSASAAPA